MDRFREDIITAKVCPYCKGKPKFIDSSVIYGKSYGMIYLCRNCDAYVGVHRKTDRSLGRLANKELRKAKKRAHHYFDQISKTGLINKIWKEYIPDISNRRKAYKWLSIKLGIDEKYCHIGMFDIEFCNRVVEICKPYIIILKYYE